MRAVGDGKLTLDGAPDIVPAYIVNDAVSVIEARRRLTEPGGLTARYA